MGTEKVGVIGAGQMGRGIAQVAAQAGYEVVLLDISPEVASKGKERIAKELGRSVEKGRITKEDAEASVGRLSASANYNDLADCMLVVEAATEMIDVKRQIILAMDEATSDECILASNTSSISLTKLASVAKFPDKVVGLHFMNPVPKMRLVEIVRALQTSDETYEKVCEVATKLDKTLVTTKDMPGFIVNRILIPFLAEACFALQEGLGTAEDIDAAAKLGLNHPMGPFELSNLIGLDTVLYIAEVMHREFGEDKYRPPAILRNYVAAGWLGRKTGRGFYNYDETGHKK